MVAALQSRKGVGGAHTPDVPRGCNRGGFRHCRSCIPGVRIAWVSVSWSLVMRRSSVRFRQAALPETGSDQRNVVRPFFMSTDCAAPGVPRGVRRGYMRRPVELLRRCMHCMGRHATPVVAFVASESAHSGEKVGARVSGSVPAICVQPCLAMVLDFVGSRRRRTASIAAARLTLLKLVRALVNISIRFGYGSGRRKPLADRLTEVGGDANAEDASYLVGCLAGRLHELAE